MSLEGACRVGLGFFCSTSDGRLDTNHTLRLSNLTRERVLETFERNLRDFLELLDLTCSMGLTVFRLGSNFIPFASHPSFRAEWLEDVEERLRAASRLIRSTGVRITMHPGQFVVLNSPRDRVVESSLRELEYHFWVLRKLEVGREGIVVVHLGGVYGNKREAVKRFVRTVEENPWLSERLAVENDEKHYTAADVLEVATALGLPAVFDYYHHVLNPSEFDMDELAATWRGVTPEFHLSSRPPREHRPGEHGDWVELSDFLSLAAMWGSRGDLDVIVEAKKKEKAVQRLAEQLAPLGVQLRRPPCYPAQGAHPAAGRRKPDSGRGGAPRRRRPSRDPVATPG